MGYDMQIENPQGHEPEGGYYRLNIWGMGDTRGAMHEVGALDVDSRAEWPKGTCDNDWQCRDEDFDGPMCPYCSAVDKVVTGDPGGDGIAAYKLGSNDGWLVTERECKVAAEKLEGVDTPEWMPSWREFLVNASKAGGFRVY